jgi:hypothetical protein
VATRLPVAVHVVVLPGWLIASPSGASGPVEALPTNDLQGQPHVIGWGDRVIRATDHTDGVWIGNGRQLVEVDRTSEVLRGPVQAPSDPLGLAVRDGLLVGTSSAWEIWDPVGQRTRCSGSSGTLLATSEDRVAWADQTDHLHILAAGTCRDSLVELPDGMTVASPVGSSAAWSPDGTALALLAEKSSRHALVIVRASGASATAVSADGQSASGDGGPIVWSPNGRALFAFFFPFGFLYPFRHEAGLTRVLVYRPADGSVVPMRVRGIPVPSSLVAFP